MTAEARSRSGILAAPLATRVSRSSRIGQLVYMQAAPSQRDWVHKVANALDCLQNRPGPTVPGCYAQSSSQMADRNRAVAVRLSGRDLGPYLAPAPMSMLVLRAEGDFRRGRFPWRTPSVLGAAMDLIDKGIKGRRTASPETGGPVAAGSFASARQSPAPLREVTATITFHGTASVHQAGPAEISALLEGLGSLIPAETRATGWVIEIVPEGEFLTRALGVPLREMGNPAASLARVPTAQEEGGPR